MHAYPHTDPLTIAVERWQSEDARSFEAWKTDKRVAPPAYVQAALDRRMGRDTTEYGRAQALLPEGLGLAVYGYQDEAWSGRDMFGDFESEYHGSESQGPGCDIEDEDDDDEYALAQLAEFALEDDADLLHRWNRAGDDLEVLDLIAENGLQVWNVEILTAFRRAQLHVLCCEYFGTKDYAQNEIVLRWTKNPAGRWMPAEKMQVAAWIEQRVAEGGSQLSGFFSAAQTLRLKALRKTAKRVSREVAQARANNRRVLTTEQVREVVAQAVAACSDEYAHEQDVTMDEAVQAFLAA